MLRQHRRRSCCATVSEFFHVRQMILCPDSQTPADTLKHSQIGLVPNEKFSWRPPIFLEASFAEHLNGFADRKHLHTMPILRKVPACGNSDLGVSGRIGLKSRRRYA